MDAPTREALRALPAVDELLRAMEAMADGQAPAPRWALLAAAREAIADARGRLLAGSVDANATAQELTPEAVVARARELARPSLREVLNAAGVVVHTNLGRSPLPEAAVARIAEVARGYSTLEYDLAAGKRGSRHVHVARLLCELTGAEDAVVVNNNAAAVMLGLAALARGREVIVSRGELVEIGGSFRIPDVMELSGARLVEVGTTNRTHPADYERAIGEQTGMLFKAHRSNFAVVGFTAEVAAEELVALGRYHDVATMFDLGSGTLTDLERFGLAGDETPVARAVAAGFDLVTFSGDKLLGGPQAGLLVGRMEAIAAVRKHPLMRALRPDKLCIAALDATLTLYREGRAEAEVPTLQMLAVTADELEPHARQLAARLREVLNADWTLDVQKVTARAGGGAYPNLELRSWAVSLTHPRHNATQLDRLLRAGDPPLIARIEDNRLLLDVRSLWPANGRERAVAAISGALGNL